MRAFDDLVRQGKILYAGVSDMPAWVVAKGNTLAELRGWTPFVGLQIEYSLIERTPERELLPMAAGLGLGITAWSPLAGGVLTGKYAEPKPGEAGGKRFDRPEMAQFHASGARATAIAREVQAVARECGRSPAQVALAWLRHRPVPIIPIIGAQKAGAVEGQSGQHRGETRPAASRPLGGGQSGGIGIPPRLLQEGSRPYDRLRRHARPDRHVRVRLASDLLRPTGRAVRKMGKSKHGLIGRSDRVFLYLALGRVSEWLAATLEMWCPERGCGFDSRALRCRKCLLGNGFRRFVAGARFCSWADFGGGVEGGRAPIPSAARVHVAAALPWAGGLPQPRRQKLPGTAGRD